ncbi:transcriptional regulator, partial [Streptococcus suis]
VEQRALDSKLFDYQQTDKKIAIRKREIQTEVSNDCNIGGGKPNIVSKPTESLVGSWWSGVRKNSQKQIRKAVEAKKECLSE